MNFKKVLLTLFVLILFLISILYPSSAFSGRPLVVDDAMPVTQGHMEFELELSQSQRLKGEREQRLPVITLTYGLFKGLEFGLGIQRVNSDSKGEVPVRGFEDLHLNTKYQFLDEEIYLPALAFTFDLKVPTANRHKGLTSGRFDENFLLIATKTFAPIALDLNLGYLLVDSPPQERLKNRLLGGLALRWAVHEKWVLVGEIFGLSREANGEKNETNFQIGVRYHLTPPIVFDATVGRSLRSSGTRTQATLGLTWTFPLNLW